MNSSSPNGPRPLSDLPMTKERAAIRGKAKYGFFWITFTLFIITLVGHWMSAWVVYLHEQEALGQPLEVQEYAVRTLREMLENWQSEFLQLIWQVLGLTWLLHVGSPQSREGDDRKEEKLDLIIKKLYPDDAMQIFQELEKFYPRS